jgi:hypothetical protein
MGLKKHGNMPGMVAAYIQALRRLRQKDSEF